MFKCGAGSAEEGEGNARSGAAAGGTRAEVRRSSGCCQTGSRCRKVRTSASSAKSSPPRRRNLESQRLIVQTQFLRNLEFTPKNCAWTSVAADSHSAQLHAQGHGRASAPGWVWLQVRTRAAPASVRCRGPAALCLLSQVSSQRFALKGKYRPEASTYRLRLVNRKVRPASAAAPHLKLSKHTIKRSRSSR